MSTMMYGITQEEAKKLVEFCGNDLQTLAILLWNYGKAGCLEDAPHKAQELIDFANGL